VKRQLLAAALALGAVACGDVPAGDAPGVPDTAAVRAAADSAAARDSAAVARERGGLTAADQGWTTSPSAVQLSAGSLAILRDVRVDAHEGFDRLVFDFGARSMPNYEVQYVASPQHQCGSGEEVRLEGGAWLSVKLQPAQAHDDAGAATVAERDRAPALPAVRQLRLTCDFEGQVEWIAGLRSQQGYRVMMLQQPNRLVVDVRH
jgi:hypothetical protein